ncbi:hypothetical protein GYB14_20355 [bacterium]|nr:hypothetical protein [bacterium]
MHFRKPVRIVSEISFRDIGWRVVLEIFRNSRDSSHWKKKQRRNWEASKVSHTMTPKLITPNGTGNAVWRECSTPVDIFQLIIVEPGTHQL